MKKIRVSVREKDKGNKDLSLFNLREEVVNFLYKDTVAISTKSDLQFFVLLFFSCINLKDRSLLEKILDEGIPKFNNLNAAFISKKGYLRAREYGEMVDEYGLAEIFENDIFFVLIEAILNIDEINKKYSFFLKKYSQIDDVIKKISKLYAPKLRASFEKFQSSKIRDDRFDELGNHHDLSKSVYRTVRMRNSRNLDLNLQKYTSVKQIKSESPIDLTFFQYIDPEIIFDLWDKYHVAEYMKSIWHILNTPLASSVFGGLIVKYWNWKQIDGKANRAEKDKAKSDFEKSKAENGHILDELTLKLVDSVLNADKKLEEEITKVINELKDLNQKNSSDKERIKKLEERIKQLENLSVEAKLVDK